MAREEKDQDTRQRILDVAEAQFGAKGYSGTHLQAIAKVVGVQKTALYYYFPSKSALYASVLERILEAFDAVVSQLTARGEPSAAAFAQALDDLNDVLGSNPNYAQILIRIFVDRIEIDASNLEPIVVRIITALMRTYAAGVEQGAYRKLSSRHVFLTVLGAAVFHYAAAGSSRAILGIDDVFAQDAVEWRGAELRKLLLGGILPRPGES